MKRYIFLSTIFALIVLLNSCSKEERSDEPISDNNAIGYYTYTSSSNYFINDNDEPVSNTSAGYMNVWTQDSAYINISVSPFYGYSYDLTAKIVETHGDTTIFMFTGQVLYLNNQSFVIIGNNGVDVPNFGKYDGYFVQDEKLEFSYKSTNKSTYENTETHTVAIKK